MINLLNALIAGTVAKDTSDEELISLYLSSQNMSYFDIIYERYSGKVLAKCITLLKDVEHARDAMHDIFMKVILNISNFKNQSKFATWLYRITYNYCIDELRRVKKITIEGEEKLDSYSESEGEEDYDDDNWTEVQLTRMKEVLDEMKPEDKSILLMKYQDDLSIKEICEITGKAESAVKMQLKRAKEKFIKILNEKTINDEI